MAVKYLSGNRLWGTNAERLAMSGDTPISADFTEDFSEITPTSWTEDSSSGYENSLRPYKDSVDGLWYDLDYSASIKLSGTLDLQNVSVLGENINDTLWTMRFKFTIASGSSGSGTFWLGFSDNADPTDTAQRFVGCRMKYSSGLTTGSDASGQALNVGNVTDAPSTPISLSDSTDYYVTVTREDVNDLKITARTGSHSGSVVGTGTSTSLSSAQDDLRYWKIMNHMASGSGSIGGRVYDLEIWNNKNTSTPFYPNLPNGSVFITSDTNVHYMWNGTDTWNEVA